MAALAALAVRANSEGEAQVQAALPAVTFDRGTLSTTLRNYIFPADHALWPSRLDVARRVVRTRNLLPLRGLSLDQRLSGILNFADPERDADRRSLIQGIVDDPAGDEAVKAPLRAAIAP